MPSVALMIHICGATIGLLSGYLAMVLRKGSGLHNAAGTVYFGSMLAMTGFGFYVALFERPNMLNAVVASLTCYLVTTGWWAGRRRDGKLSAFDVLACLFVLAVGIAGISFGFEAAGNPNGRKDSMPAGIYFFFGSAALLAAYRDVRLFMRGGVAGTQRLVRHLSRMCFALLIATFSLYPGQAKLFPLWMRKSTLLMFLPHLLLIGAFIFWAYRLSARRRNRHERASGSGYGPAMAGNAVGASGGT